MSYEKIQKYCITSEQSTNIENCEDILQHGIYTFNSLVSENKNITLVNGKNVRLFSRKYIIDVNLRKYRFYPKLINDKENIQIL